MEKCYRIQFIDNTTPEWTNHLGAAMSQPYTAEGLDKIIAKFRFLKKAHRFDADFRVVCQTTEVLDIPVEG